MNTFSRRIKRLFADVPYGMDKLNVLNIHGYCANTNDCKEVSGKGKQCYNSVGESMIRMKKDGMISDLWSPYIDYDRQAPGDINDMLRQIIEDNDIDLVTGMSMGGFNAAYLSCQLNMPCLLVNPCLLPAQDIPVIRDDSRKTGSKPVIEDSVFEDESVLAEYKGMSNDIEHSLLADNVVYILGMADTTVDREYTSRLFAEREIIEGIEVPVAGHSGSTFMKTGKPLDFYIKQVWPSVQLMLERHS